MMSGVGRKQWRGARNNQIAGISGRIYIYMYIYICVYIYKGF
jgi:hypothetical protein